MKYFVVSDVHGNASILKSSLANSGFVPNVSEQLLIICGDCFDRGAENKELFDWLNKLSNKIIIRGNHEEMLMKAIKRGYINFADVYNGTEKTVEDLFGSDSMDCMGYMHIRDYRKKKVLDFLSQTVDYYETQNYVFIHGWIPKSNAISCDWRSAAASEWSKSRWVSWLEMHGEYGVPNKTIVCGHRASKHANELDSSRAPDDNSPYYGENFIAIDANTVRSHTVNVLVIDDEPPERNVHSMRLKREFFDKVVRGSKTVEMRLFDEKRKRIRSGDTVKFIADDLSGDEVDVVVSGTYVYPSFEMLVDEFDVRSLGFSRRTGKHICEYMKRLYNDEAVSEHGVLAIKTQLLK